MDYFVRKDSVVRTIWGKADTILFIFGGAAAEFALNKAVDWLYFTGKLPADPIGRLFSTVQYARQIVFASYDDALKSIDKITAIHQSVEQARGSRIPQWAYRDVLFMLIDYSIRSFELLERKLSIAEKAEVFDVFYRVGERMGLEGLPNSFEEWVVMREAHLQDHLAVSKYTLHLIAQYRKHLGAVRFHILWEGQKLVVPTRVRSLLDMMKFSWISPLVPLYKLSRKAGFDRMIKAILLPQKYQAEIKRLDIVYA